MRSRSLSTCRAGFCTTPDSGSGTGCVPTQRRGCGSSDVGPTFRGCPDHQPGAYDQPPLSGTSEQLALCAVKHLEFDCSKRRGSITRTVGRSCCETACRSPTHRRERIPYRTSVCQRAGASKGSVSRRRGSIRLPRIGALPAISGACGRLKRGGDAAKEWVVVLGHVDQHFSECAVLGRLVRVGRLGQREPVQW
jgi:hypothetical protein